MNSRFKPDETPPLCFVAEEFSSLLSSNSQLQRELDECIVKLSRLKERNRKSAREVAASLAAAAAGNGIRDSGVGGGSISNRRVEELLDERHLQQLHATASRSRLDLGATHAAPPPPATSSTGVRKRKRSAQTARSKSARSWQQTPNRKWHRAYFVDAEGSTPQPNNDVARRAEWLRDVTSSLPSDILNYICRNNGEEAVGGNGVDVSESEGGTRSIDTSPLQKQKKKKQKAAPRLGNPLTAEERASIRATFVESGGHPDWSRIIASGESAATCVGNKATAWDCFRYIQKEASSLLLMASPAPLRAAGAPSDYAAPATNTVAAVASGARLAASKTSSLPSQPWGSDVDAILLTAVMSLGPQFNLSRDTVSNLARKLFGDRSVKQIKKRANESLVNPNYRSTAVRWTDEEERMLVLLMRAYGNCPSPLVKVFGHFPNVASKSVAEKWLRLQRTTTTTTVVAARRDGSNN